MDQLKIKAVSLGNLVLSSTVFEESKGSDINNNLCLDEILSKYLFMLIFMEGIITNSCHGKLTANVFFGKAGVGKSTVASWISSVPGLFEVGTVSGGTTTLGTWLSSSISERNYCQFSQEKFQSLCINPILMHEKLTHCLSKH